MANKPPVRGTAAQPPKTKLYEHTAYPEAPFGPYEKAEAVVRTNTQTSLAPAGDKPVFILAARIDTSEFSWGQLVINAEQVGMTRFGDNDAIWFPVFPCVEVRVIAMVGMVSFVWFEGALGHWDQRESAGPVMLPFGEGEVPDILEVHAAMITRSYASQSHLGPFILPPQAGFTVNVAARFHR